MTTTGLIYKIVNKVNGKIYVGQTRQSLTARLKAHKRYARNGKTHLANAIRKHGIENFSIHPIELASVEKLNELEMKWVNSLQSNQIGYNMSLGGDGGQNSRSPTVREKISRANTGKSKQPWTPERKAAASALRIGKKRTMMQRENIRNGRTYGPLTVDHKAKISTGLNKNWRFKLTPTQIHGVAALISNGATDAEIAEMYGVSRKTIWRIRHK